MNGCSRGHSLHGLIRKIESNLRNTHKHHNPSTREEDQHTKTISNALEISKVTASALSFLSKV